MNHKNYEGLPLFRNMEESRIREILLIAGCYIRNFKKGNYIYEENEIIRSIGLILSGHVYMIREDLWGEKDILVSMGRGEIFGENFACSPHPASSVTFYAQEEAEVLFIPYDRLLRHAGDGDVLVFIKKSHSHDDFQKPGTHEENQCDFQKIPQSKNPVLSFHGSGKSRKL